MIDANMIIWLLFVHLIADFVCQNEWMAKHKSSDNKVLLYHITSRINKKLLEDKKIHAYYICIGFDQWIHFVTLILVLNYIRIL